MEWDVWCSPSPSQRSQWRGMFGVALVKGFFHSGEREGPYPRFSLQCRGGVGFGVLENYYYF